MTFLTWSFNHVSHSRGWERRECSSLRGVELLSVHCCIYMSGWIQHRPHSQQTGVAAISSCLWGGEGRYKWESVIVWIRNPSQFYSSWLGSNNSEVWRGSLHPQPVFSISFPCWSPAVWLIGLNEALVLIFRWNKRVFFINKPGSTHCVLKWLYMYFSDAKKWIQC